MKVKFSKEEMERCALWGWNRTKENEGFRDIPDYDQERFHLSSLQNNRLGVLAEYAVYKAAGFDTEEIDTSIWVPVAHRVNGKYGNETKVPDIGGVIEVRRVNKPWNPIAIRSKDVAANAAVVQVYIDADYNSLTRKLFVPNEAELIGWRWATRGWASGATPAWSDGDSRVCHFKEDMENFDWNILKRGVAA